VDRALRFVSGYFWMDSAQGSTRERVCGEDDLTTVSHAREEDGRRISAELPADTRH